MTDENQTTEVAAQEPKPDVTYVSEKAPNLRVKLDTGHGYKFFQAKHGELRVPGHLEDLMDETIANSTGLQPLLRKVDLEAAKAMVAEIEAKRKPAATFGQFTTQQAMQQGALAEKEAQLKAAGVPDNTYVDELGGASMMMQESVKQPEPAVKAKAFRLGAKPGVEATESGE